MLTALRKGARSWAVRGLLLLLVASFGLWGIGDIFRSGRELVVAKVGDTEISARAFSNQFRQAFARMQQSMGGALTTEEARGAGLDQRILFQMIGDALFDQEAERLGLRVSDSLIREKIAETPAFLDAQGLFDAGLYRLTLQNVGLTAEEYEANLRRQETRQQLWATVTGGPPVPQAWVDTLYQHREERRVVEYIVISSSAQAEIGEPDEADLTGFHEAYAFLFTAPEYRSVSYVLLTPETLIGEIELSDDDLFYEYEARLDEFELPERRRVDQLLAPSEELAGDVRAMLQSGQNFQQIAEALGDRGVSHVSLGTVTRGELMPEIAPTVFSLSERGVSVPLSTAFGWHFFWVREILPPERQSFDQVREMLREEYTYQLANDGLYQLANALEDELAGGARLEEAAYRLNLPAVELGALDRRGLTPGGLDVELPDRANFLLLAFATDEGMESYLTETLDGTYYILRVDEITPPTLKPLDQVRDQVRAAWKEDARQNAGQHLAERVAERVGRGEELERIADEMGFELLTTAPLTRRLAEQGARLLRPILDALFGIKPGEVSALSGPTGEGYVVARVKEIVPAEPWDDAMLRDDFAAEIEDDLASDVSIQYQAALQTRFPIEVHYSVIDSLF